MTISFFRLKVLISALFILLFVRLHAQQKTSLENEYAEIVLENNEFDLGIINRGDKVKKQVLFNNNGTIPLLIKRVKNPCGCLSVKWKKDPIMPGESDSIEVKVNSYRMGSFYSQLKIVSNAKNSPVEFVVKGKVILKKE